MLGLSFGTILYDLGIVAFGVVVLLMLMKYSGIFKKLKQPLEKFPINIMNTGNCASASIPILLKEMNDKGQLVRGQKIVMASFGAGLVWNANYIEY
jgi:3-oxoacyl-[acyl-carrier-protein] synthase III